MTEAKTLCCCGAAGDLRLTIEPGDKGVVIRVESDDPQRAEALKAKLRCCGEGERSCC